jgi:predicted PurR-regulated permease PerM
MPWALMRRFGSCIIQGVETGRAANTVRPGEFDLQQGVSNPQVWQAIAAVIAALAALTGALYAVITRPLLSNLTLVQTQMQTSQTSIQAQLTDIVARLSRIEAKLDDYGERITRLEERTSPLRKG